MAAEAPEADGADLALVGGVFLEGGELGVGEGFAAEGEEPEGGAGVFERVEGRGGIERGEEKGGGEEDDGGGLQLEKPKHFGGEVGGPVPAELEVAAVFGGMMADDADGEVGAEAEAPDDGEGGDEGAAHGPARPGQGVEGGEGAERVGPGDVHDAVVVQAPRDEIEQSEAGAERGEGEEEEGRGGHAAGADAGGRLGVGAETRSGFRRAGRSRRRGR